MKAMKAFGVIEGQGTSEAQWQRWQPLHVLPEIDLVELVPSAARTVVVAPHPDDEVLATGGLLAMLAANGRQALVIGVTDGDASHPGSVHWTAEKLARHRHGEAVAGLRALGIDEQHYVRLSLPDGRVQSHQPQIIATLVKRLRPDDMVISTWDHDGHPDHEATAHAVAKACAAVNCKHLQSPVWMWHWATPGDTRVPWERMRQLRLSPEALRRKTLALRAHASQLTAQDSGLPPVLSPLAVERMLRPSEYLLLPGSDEGLGGFESVP
jgi:LmbE family N-acetylglucosaminyl deacetylase